MKWINVNEYCSEKNEFWSSPLSFLRHTVETCNLVGTWEPIKYRMLTWGIYINVQASILGERLSQKCLVPTHSWRQILLSENQRHLSYLTDEWRGMDGWGLRDFSQCFILPRNHWMPALTKSHFLHPSVTNQRIARPEEHGFRFDS